MNAALRLLVVLLSVASVAYSQTYTEGPWTYTIDYSNPSAGKANITGYSGAGGAVVIPSALGGLQVASITGFAGNTSVTSVTIPNGVTIIGNNAFGNCTSLASVTIPSSVTNIAFAAFGGCTSLTSVNIPSSVTSIGGSAFSSSGLASVNIPSSVTSIGDWAFSDSSLTSVTIPNSVTSIGASAFRRTRLTSVTIPESVTSIGNYTFNGCTSLTSVTIPNSVTSIGVGAFSLSTSLTSVTIPESVTSVASNTFYNCTGLKSVYFLGNMPSVGGEIFSGISPAGTVYYLRGNATWGASFAGWQTQPYDLPTPQQPLAVEDTFGAKLVSGANAVPFQTSLIGVASPSRVYTLRNTGSVVLSDIAVAKSGPNSAEFSLTSPASNSLAAGATTTFSVTFLPASTGARTAQVSISSNDTNSPFIINLSGVGIGENLDTDGDGLNDAAEFMMSALGFDWQSNQPTLVSTLFSNANRAQLFTRQDVMASPMTFGLYDSNSIMDLRMGGLMLQKQGGNAVVTFQPQTTGDLTQPFTNHGTPITNTIPMPWNKGFLRIQAR